MVDELSENPEMTPLLLKLHNWDLDPFEFHRITQQSGLVVRCSLTCTTLP